MFCFRQQPFYSTELNSTSETKPFYCRAAVELQSSQLSTAVARRLKQALKWNYFCSEEKEAGPNSYSPCVYNTSDPKLRKPPILVWSCKLTRFLNYEFPVHLRWKEYSCAISRSVKSFVRKRDLAWKDWRQNGYGQVMEPSLALSSFMSFSLRKKSIFPQWNLQKVIFWIL